MNFTVVWRPQALAELAETWTASADRGAVTAASHRIDLALERDPLAAGESRDGDDRILIDGPLAVIFRPVADARMVFVLSAGPFGRQ